MTSGKVSAAMIYDHLPIIDIFRRVDEDTLLGVMDMRGLADPYFFIGYLIGIAFFGLFQAIFMANAGGCWDNGKKIVEVDLKQKNTPLHEATVVGDTVGDPFKDTSSVSMNPIIKFTTLFGLLAVEIAVTMTSTGLKLGLATLFFLIALFFVYRSFYGMRIPAELEK